MWGVSSINFKKARLRAGLLQKDVADALGVDKSTVCLWETGKTKPRANILPKVAEILNCSVDFLIGDQD